MREKDGEQCFKWGELLTGMGSQFEAYSNWQSWDLGCAKFKWGYAMTDSWQERLMGK